jgi:hypothetical protein
MKRITAIVTNIPTLLTIAALVLALLALVFLSGCNLAGDIGNAVKSVEARNNGSVWEPEKHVDNLPHDTWDTQETYRGFDTPVYVYECTSEMARITPYGLDLKAGWIQRYYLEKDVCAANEP